jgi:hypothetical protein
MGTAELDHVEEFTRELLGTALWLFDLSADMAESISEDDYPGEEPGAVVVEMVVGSIRTALADTAPERLLDAIELIESARERVLEHLELALALGKRMRGENNGGPGRGYG